MSVQPDLAYLRLAVPDLEDYLLSPVTFWPLPSGSGSINEPGMNQMTLGGVLLSAARVRAAGEASAAEALAKIEQVRARWRSNWGKKAAQECAMRVDLWGKALNDLLDGSSSARATYPAQVRIRAMAGLLVNESMGEIAGIERLRALDTRLRRAAQPGPFVWEPELSGSFPEDVYWFLYVQFN